VDRDPPLESPVTDRLPATREEIADLPPAVVAPAIDTPKVQSQEPTTVVSPHSRGNPSGGVPESVRREGPPPTIAIGARVELDRSGDGKISVKGAGRAVNDPK
jgi:hypothetical protein